MSRVRRIRPSEGDDDASAPNGEHSNYTDGPNEDHYENHREKAPRSGMNIGGKLKGALRSAITVYRYADRVDYALLAVGTLMAVGQGILNSVSSVIFKGLTDSLSMAQHNAIDNDPSTKLHSGSILNDIQLKAFNSGAMSAINAYVGCGIGLFFIAFASSACWRFICERQVRLIRMNYFKSLIRQNSAWFDSHPPDDVITEMSNGIDVIKEGIGDKIATLIAYGVNFLCCIIIAFCYSWKMTLVILGFGPLLAAFIAVIAQIVCNASHAESTQYRGVWDVAEEVFRGIRTVIAYNAQEQEANRYDSKQNAAVGSGMRKCFFVAVGTAVIYLVVFIGMSVTFWLGAHILSNGQITAGAVYATFWASLGGMIALGRAIKQLPALWTALQATDSIFKVIDHKPGANSVSRQLGTLDYVQGSVEFKYVRSRYYAGSEEKTIDLSFSVGSGESIALVGQRDSGIKTVAGLLLRQHDPESGEISLDTVAVDNLNTSWLRHQIGIIRGDAVMFDGTVAHNILIGNPTMTDRDMGALRERSNALQFVAQLPERYETEIGEEGMKLSAFQRLRIEIARMLARDPRVVIVDQTDAPPYDESDDIVNNALDEARHGRTSITITHHPSAIRRSNYIFVVDNGRIVEAGTDEDLIKATGFYCDLLRAEQAEESFRDIDFHDESPEAEYAAQLGSHMTPRSSALLNAGTWQLRLVRSLMGMPSTKKDLEQLKDIAVQERFEPARINEIISFATKERKVLIGALVAAVFKGLVFPMFSLVYGSVFWSISQPKRSAILYGARMDAVWFFLLGVFAAAVTLAACFLFGWTGESLTARLRKMLFGHILMQDGAYFDTRDHSPHRLVTCLSNDVPRVRVGIDQKLANVMQNISAILVGVIIAFAYGPAIAPLGILLALILIGAQAGIELLINKRSVRDADAARKPSRLVIEGILHHEAVQCLTQEQYFSEQFEQEMQQVHKQSIIRLLIQALASSLQVCFAFINFACLYRLGVALINSNRYQPFNVFQVVESLNCASMSILTFNMYVPEYVRARYSAGLIFNMLKQRPKIDSTSEAGSKLDLCGSISMDHVHFAYPSNRNRALLRSVTLNLTKGKTTVLSGATGCGKSAVIELLQRLYDPMDGVLRFDGKDSREINARYLRAQMGVVGREPVLFNYTIRENITYGLAVQLPQQHIEEAASMAGAHQFIQMLPKKYETRVFEDGVMLTLAQQQKIAIARAIIRDPMILLFDEATSALEPEEQNDVEKVLSEVRQGRTCVMTTREMKCTQNADVVVVLKEGRVWNNATIESL